MRILVTGANGFVGSAVMARLQLDKDSVLGAVRQNPQADQIAVGDLDETTDWGPALTGIEAVIHTAARAHQMEKHHVEAAAEFRRVNVAGTLNLAQQAARAGVRRFVFISSIKAMGEYGYFHTNDDCQPQDAYGMSKRDAELGLWKIANETGMEIVILRLPLVYGPGVKANFLRLMLLVERGIPLPFKLVHNARSLIGLTNLVDAIATCTRHPAAAGKIYLISDGDAVSTPELIRVIAKAFGREARLVPIPLFLMRTVTSILGKNELAQRLLDSLTVDVNPLQQELDWKPPMTFQQGINETVAWYRQTTKGAECRE